tara:strand:- start:532 stop:651 length:120 start_codon:yes stop_codon:yes gene_type:complete
VEVLVAIQMEQLEQPTLEVVEVRVVMSLQLVVMVVQEWS